MSADGDEVVIANPDEVSFLTDSRIGTADLLGDGGQVMRAVSWEITTTPQPGQGETTRRVVMLTVNQLVTVRGQIDYLLAH